MTVSLTEIKIIDTTEELALCYPLMKQLRINLTREDFLNVYQEAHARENYVLVAAKNLGQIVGLMGYRFLHDFVHGKHLYIDDLVTDEQHRSKGIGAELLKYAESVASANNCKGMRLCTGIENSKGMKFYQTQGWALRAHAYKKKLVSN